MSTGFNGPVGGTDNTSSVSSGGQSTDDAISPASQSLPQDGVQRIDRLIAALPGSNLPYSGPPLSGSTPIADYQPNYAPPPAGHDLQGTIKQLTAAAAVAEQAQQQISQQLTGQCNSCMQTVADAQNNIVQQIVTKLTGYQTCVSNCQEHISSQVATMVAETTSTATNIIERCPACTPCESPIKPTIYIPPDALGNAGQYIPGVADGGNRVTMQPSPVPPITIPGCDIPPVDCSVYRGYCNTVTGDVTVILFSDLMLLEPWIFVVAGPDREKVLEATESWCTAQQDRKKKIQTSISLTNQFGVSGPGCNIDDYKDQEKNDIFFSDIVYQQIQAFATEQLDNVASQAIKLASAPNPEAGAILGAARGALTAPQLMQLVILPKLTELLGCTNGRFTSAAKMLGVLKYWESRAGIDFAAFRKIYDYTMNINCRQRHLSPEQAMAAYLSDAISSDELDIYWGIHGYCHEDLTQSLRASRSKPVPAQLAEMRRRKIIGDSDYRNGMRQLGYLEPTVASELYRLSEYVPSIGESMRFANADVTNDDNAKILQLDADFEARLPTAIRNYLDASGVMPDTLKQLWREHWNTPGIGQQYAMFHRTRRNVAFGEVAEQEKYLRAAVEQQGMTPIDAKRAWELRYNPLPFRHLRMSYDSGAVTDDGLNDRLSLLGFSDDDCKVLGEQFAYLKEGQAERSRQIKLWISFVINGDECKQQMLKIGYSNDLAAKAMADNEIHFAKSTYAKAFVSGELQKDSLIAVLTNWGCTRHGAELIVDVLAMQVRTAPPVDDYSVGIIDRADAITALTDYGMASQRIEYLLGKIDSGLTKQSLSACMRGIRKQYNTGGLNSQQAMVQLTQRGMTPLRANMIVQDWQCEQASKGKQVPVATLCNWLSQGAITNQQYIDRLTTIGFSQDDAGRMLVDCLAKINAGLMRQAQKMSKEQATAQDKADRQRDKAAKVLEQEAAKLQSARAKAAATKLRRDKQLAAAADKLNKALQSDIYTVSTAAAASLQYVRATYGLSLDESLQVILLAAENFKGKTIDDYGTIVDATAKMLVQSQLSALSDSNSSLGSVNGSSQPPALISPL